MARATGGALRDDEATTCSARKPRSRRRHSNGSRDRHRAVQVAVGAVEVRDDSDDKSDEEGTHPSRSVTRLG